LTTCRHGSYFFLVARLSLTHPTPPTASLSATIFVSFSAFIRVRKTEKRQEERKLFRRPQAAVPLARLSGTRLFHFFFLLLFDQATPTADHALPGPRWR
jgi:hypothetical protein